MLSIIVPVYNSEKYLKTCIDSIIAQTFTDYELILVDDGSKDGSRAICEEYGSKDKRIRTVHKENGGVSSARNKGLDMATGDFIMFVDSDDWLLPDLCEKLMGQTDNADLVIGGIHEIRTSFQRDLVTRSAIISFSDIGEWFDELYEKSLTNAPYSKIYQKKLIKNLRFPLNVATGEDFLFNLQYFIKCKDIALVSTTSYIYNCLNEGSATRNFRESDIRQNVNLYYAGKKFQKKYCGKYAEKSVVVDKRLCSNCVGMAQLIFYSEVSDTEKRRLINELFSESTIINSCERDYHFPAKIAIPQHFCKMKSYEGLKIYFFCKKRVQKVINGIKK